jgi:hypothetical protein
MLGVYSAKLHDFSCVADNTDQQNLTIFFGPRGKIFNPNRTFNADFKCLSSFSSSPTVFL